VSLAHSVVLSDATLDDIEGIHQIYAYHVKHGTGSFEESAPSVDDIHARWVHREARNYPTLIARIDQQIVGYAYAHAYKERSAYRFSVEDSVYVSPDFVGQGVGVCILSELIDRCKASGFQQMMAIVGDSDNTASIALHKRCGFRQIGCKRI